MIFLSGEVGVGGGIIVGGRPLTGVAGYGGEVGHIPVNPLSGRRCRCGSVGCWETEVGEEALLVRAGRPADGGSAAVEAVLADAAAGDADGAGRRSTRSVAGWASGSPASSTCSTRRASCSAGASPVSTRSSPTTVEDGSTGGRSPRLAALVEIVPATLGVDAPLLGAAELAFEPILDRSGELVRRTGHRRFADWSTWSPTRGGTANMSRLRGPIGFATRNGGGDSHARSSIGSAHHERGPGPGRLRRRR